MVGFHMYLTGFIYLDKGGNIIFLGKGEYTEQIMVNDNMSVSVEATASAKGKVVINYNTKNTDTSAVIIKVKTCFLSKTFTIIKFFLYFPFFKIDHFLYFSGWKS